MSPLLMKVTSAKRRAGALMVGLVASAGLLGACRGDISSEPPIHLIGDMDWQPHRRPQSESKLFADHRASRPIDPRTVARGQLRESDAIYKGVDTAGKPLKRMPIEVTSALLERGEERFNIYCTPCHDKTGGGQGIVIQRSAGGFASPTRLYDDRLKEAPDGDLFDVISHGRGNMPSYAAQVPTEDRWAIIAHVRVLQQSQAAKRSDVPSGTTIAPEGDVK